MTVTTQLLTDAQRLIYGRKRIVDSFYQKDPKVYSSLQATDIQSIDLKDGFVRCTLSDSLLFIERSAVIKNFWEHRTRTPSFFDYKIWSSYANSSLSKGIPVGALDYGKEALNIVLESHLGRVPRLAVDKDGVKKLYFVVDDGQVCTCESWAQLYKYRDELEDEFDRYSSIKFAPVCKHLQWSAANIKLQALRFKAIDPKHEYNPRLCVYYFDHRRGLLSYRVTHDGVKTNGQWLPVDGWKEKPVYDSGGMPTGACWETFTAALNTDKPFKIIPYSQSVAVIMNKKSSK